MHPITKVTICAFAAATMAAPAYAAADFFLKLDGPIKGESSDRILNPVPRGGGKQVEITSWSFGATNAGRVRKIDNFASKRQHRPLRSGSVTVQSSLPDCTVGARYTGAQLGGGATVYEFKDIMVTSCTLDSISFDYASFRESPSPSAR